MDIKKKFALDMILEIPESKFEEILFEMLAEKVFSKSIDLY